MKFASTKTYTHAQGLSACFRQWRAKSHCRFLHGYALEVQLTFQGDLDERNWVIDFGSLKIVKSWLEDMFDHKLIAAEDDPEKEKFMQLAKDGLAQIVILPHVGCEAFAETIYKFVDNWLQKSGYASRVSLFSVEVREHAGNSAICYAD